MVNVISRRCKFQGCAKVASFSPPGSNRPKSCRADAQLGMVSADARKLCSHPGYAIGARGGARSASSAQARQGGDDSHFPSRLGGAARVGGGGGSRVVIMSLRNGRKYNRHTSKYALVLCHENATADAESRHTGTDRRVVRRQEDGFNMFISRSSSGGLFGLKCDVLNASFRTALMRIGEKKRNQPRGRKKRRFRCNSAPHPAASAYGCSMRLCPLAHQVLPDEICARSVKLWGGPAARLSMCDLLASFLSLHEIGQYATLLSCLTRVPVFLLLCFDVGRADFSTCRWSYVRVVCDVW